MAADYFFLASSSFLTGLWLNQLTWLWFIFSLAFLILIKRQKLLLLGVLFFILGGYYAAFNQKTVSQTDLEDIINEDETYAEVISEGRENSFNKEFIVAIKPKTKTQPRVKALLELPPYSQVNFGDELKLKAKKEIIDQDYYLNQKIFLKLRPNQIEVIGRRQSLQSFLIKSKNSINEKIKQKLSFNASQFLAGLLYGKEINDPELKNNLKKTGLSHLTAVSGYNLTLISSIVFEFLKIFPLSRLILFFLSTFSILIFSLFVGGQASVIRASLMGVLIIFCKSSGRIPLKRNVLTAAAISISLFQPSTLIFDLGFQLSFLATIGILYLAQPLEKLFRFKVLAETFSAQLLTLPIIWYHFGQINFFSLFINAIVLPIIPSLMILGLIAIFLINLPFIQLISLPYDLLAKVIGWLSLLPPTNFQPPLFLIVALYLFAFAFIYKLNKNALPDFSLNFK